MPGGPDLSGLKEVGRTRILTGIGDSRQKANSKTSVADNYVCDPVQREEELLPCLPSSSPPRLNEAKGRKVGYEHQERAESGEDEGHGLNEENARDTQATKVFDGESSVDVASQVLSSQFTISEAIPAGLPRSEAPQRHGPEIVDESNASLVGGPAVVRNNGAGLNDPVTACGNPKSQVQVFRSLKKRMEA